MKSLMYRSPVFYILNLRIIHGREFERRYREVAKIAGGRRIFEVGCGPGILGRYVKNYSGMDLNERFVRYAKKSGYRCYVGDIFKEDFPSADVGVAVDVLHHLIPREKELIEKMRENFPLVIVIEPVKAFNIRMPRFLRKVYDSIFGDADGINPLRNREKWNFSEKELMDYMKAMGAGKVYLLGKDVVAIFKGPKDPDR